MNQKTVLAFLTVLVISVLSGCKQDVKATVNCKGQADGMSCEIAQTQGDAKVNVTWEIKAKCKNGTVVTGLGAGEVSGGGKATVLVPNSKLENDEKCDAAESMTIENLKITGT
jgi:hypothetical protein